MLKLSSALAIIGLGLIVLSFVLTPTATPPPTAISTGDASLVATGKTLFTAKGCAVCHLHSAVTGSGQVGSGPNLSAYRAEATYLKSWLSDPKAVRATATMPNLGLSSQEINALVAFLNNPAGS